MATIPITVRRVLSGYASLPVIKRWPENAGSSALMGVPVQVTAGYVDEAATINDATDQIFGFSMEFFHDLDTDGVPKTLTYGAVQNQSNAVLIPGGAPLSDGCMGVVLANANTEFIGRVGPTQTVTATDLGASFGLTKDTNDQWYVDTSITTANTGACVKITEVIDASTEGGLVAFVVLAARYQQVILT